MGLIGASGAMWIAGVDGCPAGWFRTAFHLESRELDFRVCASAAALLAEAPVPGIIAIDIPIGLAGRGMRACDGEARSRLGWPRRSSVFPPPLRPALSAASQAEATRITREIDGKGVGAQAFNIYAKIREVDAWLRASPAPIRERVYEAHPELCFQAWAGGRAMAHGKRTSEGREERLRLVEAWLGPGVLARARTAARRSKAADDDILDSIATLWTAQRIARGGFVALGDGAADECGLPMRICY